MCIFFFKQKTAYEMRISDWSSDVCSSDLCGEDPLRRDLSRHDRGGVRQCGRPLPDELVPGLDGGAADERLPPADDLRCGDRGPAIGRASCRERVCQYV